MTKRKGFGLGLLVTLFLSLYSLAAPSAIVKALLVGAADWAGHSLAAHIFPSIVQHFASNGAASSGDHAVQPGSLAGPGPEPLQDVSANCGRLPDGRPACCNSSLPPLSYQDHDGRWHVFCVN